MELSRRALLRAGAGTAAASATAGCLDALPFVGGPGVDLSPVPAGADAVVRVDAATALSDEGVRAVGDVAFGDRDVRAAVDGVLGTALAAGPESLAGWESLVRSTYGLDPRAASTVTGFVMAAPDNPERTAVGTVVEADWEATTVREALDVADLSVAERDTGSLTVYELEGTPATVGVLEDGRYVAGVYGAVPLVASVVDGGTDPVGGSVASAFAASGGGPVRFGARAAPLVDVVVSLIPGRVELIREQLFAEIRTVSGSIVVEDEERVLRVRAVADSASTAEDLESAVEAARVLAARNRDPDTRTAIESVETSLDGDTLSVTYRADVDDLAALARAIAGLIG